MEAVKFIALKNVGLEDGDVIVVGNFYIFIAVIIAITTSSNTSAEIANCTMQCCIGHFGITCSTTVLPLNNGIETNTQQHKCTAKGFFTAPC